MAFTERVNSSGNSLYNEDRNLLRIREKERRNQEAHQEKEAFPEKIPLFGEPYKTEKGDELSSRIQNMLGNYEEVKEFLSTKSHPHRLDASENRLGKPRYPLFPEKGSSIPSHSFHTSVHHQPINTPASGPLPVGNISHNPKMAQPRMEPMPSVHVKNYGPPDSQHLTQDRLGQEGYGSTHHKKGDRRADGDRCASVADSAPGRELSPLLSSLPSPVPPLSPIHSNQQALPRTQESNKVHSSSNNNKGYCPAKSPKDLAVKVHDKDTPQDSLVAVASLGVAPPQPPSQTFPPPSLPSKSIAMQQKPTAYVRPMDGQDQAPSESPELKPLPEDYRQHTFEKTDLKVPARAKLTKLKMPSQSVEQTYSSEVHCVEEILKEMTHSWPPPLTAIHTPSTAEPSKFPFPTKDSQHISSATPNQKQYDTSSKTHTNSQQGTSMLEDDLQLSDSEGSDNEQAPEKPPSASAPPSAPQSLPEAAASAHSSSAESESTSDSDSSSDSESESSSSDSEENEPLETPAPEPEPPTTNKWQLDNWLTKVSQPAAPPEALGGAEPPPRHLDGKGKGDGGGSGAGHEHSESKDPAPKSSSKAPRLPSEGPHAGKRSSQKSPAQQEPPQRQTVGTKQPRKSGKAPAPADARAGLQVESEPGPPPHGPGDQPAKDKPKVKTKGRPRAADGREPRPAGPAPGERKKHRSGPPAPPKALPGPEPTKDNVEDRSPEHFALVPLTQSQGPPRGGGRTSGCRRAVVVQEDRRKDKLPVPPRDTKLLSPLRDTPPPQTLMVKITLELLSRIPQPPGKGSRQRKPEDRQPPAGKKLDSEKRSADNSSKLAKKRKGEAERDHDSKKVRLEKEIKSQASSSSSHKESSKTKTPRPSSEPSKKEMLPPQLVLSSSSQKPAKPAQKKPRREADLGGQDPAKSASSTKGSHKDSSVPKHRKAEGKGSESSTEHKGSSGDIANPFPVPSLPNGNSKPGKPQVKFDKQQADFHMKEAKKLKIKAETTTNKVGKAFKYMEAVLSLIQCGIAMESEGPASKSAYSVYSETVDLINFMLSLKSFSDATTPTLGEILAVLCMRCQSILNMAMFRCKKDIAIKYSRTLNEHFKISSKVAQAPSPCIARSTGTPSPLSPMPSPASSVGSQSSAGSVGSSGMHATVSTPVTIQNMTSSYVTITSHILTAFDLWEQAEFLARNNKEFFAQLSTSACALALNSSLMDLVHYTRQGFQRLKQVTKTP
ncbi:LOW QUALITY PROTEIN: AF4/FMR2 family member 1 [Diceros bicornis minor]|uniref:LOW QUALITY PROTEIN: AF4/FMR2 family member 1 n=1 Tax=Diceros bicornis minor TaxID=77932 RepID=UPI0026F251E2|nr:LOW QUALITY PROTEIN: AF4/FMR2 family member 1 [Diceros bicornis minor]